MEGTKVDGRRARGLRTRDAIVSALMDLIASGDISPTAQRIADRAGVSVRSVYQHFTDVEGLYADAAARTNDWVLSMTPEIDPAWPIVQRLEVFTNSRSTILEAITPFNRASRLVEPTSASIEHNRLALQHEGRDRLEVAFGPELSGLAPVDRASVLGALDVLSSWAAWEHLRSSGASLRVARDVMRTGMAALLGRRPGS
ncbi:MAG: TetR/AcrR family transcriptional regulator [Acidimicrobiales bacterium]